MDMGCGGRQQDWFPGAGVIGSCKLLHTCSGK